MTEVKALKVTCHVEPKKLVYVMPLPSLNYSFLRRHLELYLFQERLLPKFDIRTYWIDDEDDEVEIESQNDYRMFLARHDMEGKLKHMQIGYAEKIETVRKCVEHTSVECDGCLVKPIVGFRYKCLQCKNYDLCQRCESQCKHPNHIMVRLPAKNIWNNYTIRAIKRD